MWPVGSLGMGIYTDRPLQRSGALSLILYPSDLSFQRANFLSHPRQHLADEAEAKQHHAGNHEDHDQIEERPEPNVWWTEPEIERHYPHQQADQEEDRARQSKEQHRLAAEAQLEPDGHKIEHADRNTPDPELDAPARRGYSGTGCSASRNPWDAAITTMKRCQSGRVGKLSITSRRYALTPLRSLTRTPKSQRLSALYIPDTKRFSYCPRFVPVTMSACPARIGATSEGMSAGMYWRSAG